MLSFDVSVVDVVMALAVLILLIYHISDDWARRASTERKAPPKKATIVLSAMAARLRFVGSLLNLASLFLIALGSIVLAWVGWLIWYDMTTWGKDIVLIFFGSRTGEAISLRIGMIVFYYFLIGLALSLSGLLIFFRSTCMRIFTRVRENAV